MITYHTSLLSEKSTNQPTRPERKQRPQRPQGPQRTTKDHKGPQRTTKTTTTTTVPQQPFVVRVFLGVGRWTNLGATLFQGRLVQLGAKLGTCTVIANNKNCGVLQDGCRIIIVFEEVLVSVQVMLLGSSRSTSSWEALEWRQRPCFVEFFRQAYCADKELSRGR